ncbi:MULTISPECIES: hypothetical protein [unclassified Microbacterium]|uniref:hypothetical protein n=1 Tax=unclassified Microbacterium TaxID=2609290 RepID=UPI000EA8A401|nr:MULTISPECIES: hypothetical protein [unclassified Microbacterium]MBT2486401.1 hypothetical protein [Microbacterium sp. ISL-108]RKN69104.1 hypothetical protein D7252_17010 [Microbacterium sp. CGR2]
MTRGTRIPLLEDITPAEHSRITDAEASRVRAGNAAEVWRLTVKTRASTTVAESLFTVPLGDQSAQYVAERVFSILAAVKLGPEQGWREVRAGHICGPVKHVHP